jgi:hypothetical protein
MAAIGNRHYAFILNRHYPVCLAYHFPAMRRHNQSFAALAG